MGIELPFIHLVMFQGTQQLAKRQGGDAKPKTAAGSKLPSSTKSFLIIRRLLRPVECGPAGNNMGAIGRT